VQPLDFDQIDPEKQRERWLDCGPFALRIAYASPAEMGRFRRRLLSRGIWRESHQGMAQVNPGREHDFHLELAKGFVLGWRGVTEAGSEVEYSPEKMAAAFAARGDILAAVQEAIIEADGFFGRNGTPPI